MEEEKAIWEVSGNMDQIKKHGLDTAHDWVQRYPDKVPNRVYTKFEDHMSACDLYNKMRGLKIAALRNWLD